MWFIIFIWFTLCRVIICGDEGKLAGGKAVKSGEFPFTLAVTGSVTCGGTLVEPNKFFTIGEHFAKPGFSKDSVFIIGGSVSLEKGSDGRQERKLKSFKVHPRFKEKNTKSYYFHNIAIGILDKPFSVTNSLAPAVLPAYARASYLKSWNDYVASEKSCFVVGWGNKEDGTKDNIQKAIEVTPWADSLCSSMSKPEDDMTGKGEACATALQGKEYTVPSDAGSPLSCGGSVYGMVAYQYKIGHERSAAFLLFWPYLEEFGVSNAERHWNTHLGLSLLLLDILLTFFAMKIYN